MTLKPLVLCNILVIVRMITIQYGNLALTLCKCGMRCLMLLFSQSYKDTTASDHYDDNDYDNN